MTPISIHSSTLRDFPREGDGGLFVSSMDVAGGRGVVEGGGVWGEGGSRVICCYWVRGIWGRVGVVWGSGMALC